MDALTRLSSVDPRHQQVVVVGVAVADRCKHGERDRLRVERTCGGGAADPTAASQRGVCRDLLAPLGRACREETCDLACEVALEGDVFMRAPFRCALTLTCPRVLISQALGSRARQIDSGRTPAVAHEIWVDNLMSMAVGALSASA